MTWLTIARRRRRDRLLHQRARWVREARETPQLQVTEAADHDDPRGRRKR